MTCPEGVHIQVELPSPTNPNSSWDSLHALDRLAKTSFIRNPHTSNWSHHDDGVLVSVTGPIDIDHDLILSRKLRTPCCCRTRSLTRHICGSDLSLEESDPDAAEERSQSPGESFTDEHDTSCLDREPPGGDCRSNLIESHTTDNTELSKSTVSPSLTRTTRIRFRSRVRITSGLNRHRQSSTKGAGSRTNTLRSTSGDSGCFCCTPSSSISGSPSSSISAPLRSRRDDEADRPGWGPLGRRVSMLAKKDRTKKQFKLTDDDQPWGPQSDSIKGLASRARVEPTEASPLLMAPPGRGSGYRACLHGRRGRCYCIDCGLPSHKRLSSDEVDETFGKWPNRMLNYQWWWWQAESVICSRCLDESDNEYT